MNKFWQWMKKKGYAEWDSSCNVFWPPHFAGRDLHCINSIPPFTPQMLIGYKLEYVRDHATFWEREHPYWSGDQMTINFRLSMLWDCIDISKEIDDIIMIIDNEETS